jgi:hypothetical protein
VLKKALPLWEVLKFSYQAKKIKKKDLKKIESEIRRKRRDSCEGVCQQGEKEKCGYSRFIKKMFPSCC